MWRYKGEPSKKLADELFLAEGLASTTVARCTPGGRDWVNGRRIGDAERPRLVAAFNGGFRFEHIAGGYFTENREVRPLVDGEATAAIDKNGKITVGEYGRDLTNDGT